MHAITVLLVEDDKDNLDIYRTILEHEGHRVISAGDGMEAVEVALESRPEVILMDISLPILDGYQATRLLKADSRTRDIPVIALTAHAGEENRAKALRAGCDSYLSKPVPPRAVLEEVERLGKSRYKGTPLAP